MLLNVLQACTAPVSVSDQERKNKNGLLCHHCQSDTGHFFSFSRFTVLHLLQKSLQCYILLTPTLCHIHSLKYAFLWVINSAGLLSICSTYDTCSLSIPLRVYLVFDSSMNGVRLKAFVYERCNLKYSTNYILMKLEGCYYSVMVEVLVSNTHYSVLLCIVYMVSLHIEILHDDHNGNCNYLVLLSLGHDCATRLLPVCLSFSSHINLLS